MNVSHLLVKKSFFLFDADMLFLVVFFVQYSDINFVWRLEIHLSFVKEKERFFGFLCMFNDALNSLLITRR